MRLKELRNNENLNQEDVAKIIQVARTTYSSYEQGLSEPNIETLCKLADHYNTSLDYLVGRNFNNELGYLSDQERAMIETFKKLNEVNQIKVASYALGILSTQEN